MNVFNYGWWIGADVVSTGSPIVQVGSLLAFEELEPSMGEWGPEGIAGARVRFVDISDPDFPAVLPPVTLPDGAGYTGLVSDGSRVLLSHYEPTAEDPTKVRFYLDRIDLTAPFMPIGTGMPMK